MFIADKNLAELVEIMGFYCRGKKTGSRKIDNQYYDEIGVELSFFNINDAKELLKISVKDEYQNLRVTSALDKCREGIHSALTEKCIDQYTALYIENMAFQMIREGLGEIAIHCYGQKDKDAQPWYALIQELPASLKEDFLHLDKLTTKTYLNEFTEEYSVKKNLK